jgi:site-specific recombinase XerD
MTELITSTVEKWLTSLNKSPNTRRMHSHAINVFTSWLDTQATDAEIESLNVALLMDYVEFLQKERRDPPLGDNTIRSYIGVVLRWLQWLVDQQYLDGIQSEEGRLAPHAVRGQLYEVIGKEALAEELAQPMPDLRRLGGYYELQRQQYVARVGNEPDDSTDPKARRDYLNIMRNRSLVALLFSTDIWVSDVLTLTAQSITNRGQVTTQAVIKARGGEHTIYLNDLSRLWMAEYLAVREEWYSDSVDVFISHGPKADGKRMSVRSVERVIKEAGAWLADQRAKEGADPVEIAALRALAPNMIRRFVLQTMAETIVRPRIELDLSDALSASQ